MANQKRRSKIPFLTFVACTFVGILFGLIWNNLTAGVLIGLGAGLILLAMLRFILYRKREVEIKSDDSTSSD